MKSAIVIAEGVKQVMLVAESEAEKGILKILGEEGQEMSVEFKQGSFYARGVPQSALAFRVRECQAGYLRAYPLEGSGYDSDSTDVQGLMIVLRPKAKVQIGDLVIESAPAAMESSGLPHDPHGGEDA